MKRLFLQLIVFLFIAPSSYAVSDYPFLSLLNDTIPQDSIAAKSDSTKVNGDKKKDDKKKNEYEELIKKDSTKMEGLFTVRHIEDKWYFEVPDSMLGKYLLAVTRYTAVPQNFGKFAGEEANEATVYFEKRDKKTMLLRAYVLSQLANEKDDISKTLRASTVDPIVASFKIIGENPDSTMSLIEVTSMLKGGNSLIGISKGAASSLKIGGLVGDRSFIDTLKVFPINIEVVSTLTYGASGGASPASGTGSMTVGLNTSIIRLPDTPMRMRLWDERVGYFTNRVTFFSDEQHKSERESFISRHRLVPKNLAAYRRGELVEPIKPIIYYIDPATPKKWVPYLIQGINDWNVAFEAAGFKNAIQGREWPNDPNMSVDDARYCVLRYLPAEIENAYGPCVVDPRSGEIIESHICWYHNVMNLLTKWYMTQCGPLDKRAQKMKFDDKLMGELIRFVSSHEVGHTLGLRHNMGASHATPVEKLRDKRWVEQHGHTASIMDYARFNYVAQPEDNVSERGLFPRINDYDKWAIKWGYQYRPEFKDEQEEKKQLMKETTKVLEKNPRLWFSGEGMSDDPREQTEDLGDNNMRANEYGLMNLKRVMAGLPEWTKEDNYQYDDLKEMYASVRDQFNRYMRHVMKNIGGHYISNLPATKPYDVVPATIQKEALAYLGRNIFTAPMWLYPEGITEKVGFNAANDIKAMQRRALDVVLSRNILEAINNDSFRSSEAYKVDAYLSDVFNEIWRPLEGKNELQDKCRRDVENAYMENIDKILNPTNPNGVPLSVHSDVNLYVEQHLQGIEDFCTQQTAVSSGINRLHYNDILRQIRLTRERMTTVRR